MKWLFLMVLFDTSAGDMIPKVIMRNVFATEAECNQLGRGVEKEIAYEDNSLKSFSICLPESVYAERGLQTNRLGHR